MVLGSAFKQQQQQQPSSAVSSPMTSPNSKKKQTHDRDSEHSKHPGDLHAALSRALSWDLPQGPPRKHDKIRKHISELKKSTSSVLLNEEDGLPTCEPFKIKMIESITLLPKAKRESLLAKAGYNVFCLRSDQVFIDLLTDSGTSAMSDVQWANMLNTPQAYAGSSSFYTLEGVVQDLFGFKHVLPEHQGRAAENVLFSTVVAPKPGCFVPNNTHFDTTEANVLRCGGHPVNLAVKEAYDTGLSVPFKGNMDVEALEAFIADKGVDNIPLIMITVTNNSAGGQPVSMGNMQQVSEIARRHGIPLFVDAARFAENCWFIQRWEPGYSKMSLRDIAHKLFSYADGCTFSGKKEALANVGGLLCCNDDMLYEQLRNLTIVVEGYPTYGGLACRDLVAMARGLLEATDEAYQEYRHGQIELLAGLLRDAGVPIVEPPGGHAVYIDAQRFLPHIPQEQFPAQALTAAVYAVSGVRGVEIGSSCFGRVEEETGQFIPARLELMRLALPRRVYTDQHLRYVAAGIIQVFKHREAITGLKRVYATKLLSHFTARFEPIGAVAAAAAGAGGGGAVGVNGTPAAAAAHSNGGADFSNGSSSVGVSHGSYSKASAEGKAATAAPVVVGDGGGLILQPPSVKAAAGAAADAISSTAADVSAKVTQVVHKVVEAAAGGVSTLRNGTNSSSKSAAGTAAAAAAAAPAGDEEEEEEKSQAGIAPASVAGGAAGGGARGGGGTGVHDCFAQETDQPMRQQQAW